MATYTFLVTGASASGKSAFLRRLSTGAFLKEHVPSETVTGSIHGYNTTRGYMTLKVLEGPADQLRLLQDRADAVLVFVDLSRRSSLQEAQAEMEFYSASGCPLVICGNKADLVGEDNSLPAALIRRELITKYQKRYFQVSARTNFNLEKPFLETLRQLTGDSKLMLIPDQPTESLVSTCRQFEASTGYKFSEEALEIAGQMEREVHNQHVYTSGVLSE